MEAVMTEQNFREKVASRKFVLMLMIFGFSTVCLAMPAIIFLMSGTALGTLLTGGEYASLIIGCFAIYAGANVAQKKFAQQQAPKTPKVYPKDYDDDMMAD
jgi:hypothetical protein